MIKKILIPVFVLISLACFGQVNRTTSQEPHRTAAALNGSEKIRLAFGGQNYYSTINDIASALSILNLLDPTEWLKSLTGYDNTTNQIYLSPAGDTTDSFVWSPSGWSLTGNSGTNSGTNFIGTTDTARVLIKTDNTTIVSIGSDDVAFPKSFIVYDSLGAPLIFAGKNSNDLSVRIGDIGGVYNGTMINIGDQSKSIFISDSLLNNQGKFNNTDTIFTPTIKISGGSPGTGKVLTGTDASGNASWQTHKSSTQLIGTLASANMNTTADQNITLTGGTNYIITDVIITNASVNLTTAADGEIWSGASRTGSKIFSTLGFLSAFEYLSALTTSSKYINNNSGGAIPELLIQDYSVNSSTVTTPVVFSLSTPQGSAATASVYVFGYILN